MNISLGNFVFLMATAVLASVVAQINSTQPFCLAAEPIQERDATIEIAVEEPELPAAPESFVDLVERGNVEFEFYDQQADPRKFPGETRFDFRVKYQFRYKFTIRKIDGERTAIVKPMLEDLNVVCSSKIILPDSLPGDEFWSKRLVVHEFEHVRLNCDARPRMLAEYLLKRIKRLEQTLKDDATVDKEKIKEAFAAKIQEIRKEVVRIMQANNDYLDEVTRHGAKKLEDAEGFFAELYAEENLAKYKFAYLDDVRTLLKSTGYRESE